MPRKQEAKTKTDKQQRLFILISGLEEPIDHATALANAISLIAAGLRARHDNASEALIAVIDMLEDELAMLKGMWRGLHSAAGGRTR